MILTGLEMSNKTANTDMVLYHIVHNSHALGSSCLDALKHVHYMLSFESLQLRIEHYKHSTATTAITALNIYLEK